MEKVQCGSAVITKDILFIELKGNKVEINYSNKSLTQNFINESLSLEFYNTLLESLKFQNIGLVSISGDDESV